MRSDVHAELNLLGGFIVTISKLSMLGVARLLLD